VLQNCESVPDRIDSHLLLRLTSTSSNLPLARRWSSKTGSILCLPSVISRPLGEPGKCACGSVALKWGSTSVAGGQKSLAVQAVSCGPVLGAWGLQPSGGPAAGSDTQTNRWTDEWREQVGARGSEREQEGARGRIGEQGRQEVWWRAENIISMVAYFSFSRRSSSPIPVFGHKTRLCVGPERRKVWPFFALSLHASEPAHHTQTHSSCHSCRWRNPIL